VVAEDETHAAEEVAARAEGEKEAGGAGVEGKRRVISIQ
jgi:hypothetical protein